MNTKKKIIISIFSAIFIILCTLSFFLKNTIIIWYLTRIYGLISYFLLFLVILFGEFRLLNKIKAKFKLFRYHKYLGALTGTFILLHFFSAFVDNYKWGKALSKLQFFGFAYSNKWIILLSIGTLASYLVLFTAIISSKKIVKLLKYKNWKILHFLAYFSFVMAYIHSVNLGTDFKTSTFTFILKPLIVFSFLIIISLLFARLFRIYLDDQIELSLTAILMIILIFGSVFLGTFTINKESKISKIEKRTTIFRNEIHNDELYVQNLVNQTYDLMEAFDDG